MSVDKEQLKRLAEPFNQNEIFWRPIATNKPQGMAQVIPYARARAYRARLNEICGVENWRQSFFPGPAGGILCRLEILVERSQKVAQVSDAEWVWKDDGATNPSQEKLSWSADPEDISVKGGFSNAFKRAALSWDIGAYLQYAPQVWIQWDFTRKCAIHPPMLPTRKQMIALHTMGSDLYGEAWDGERALAVQQITQGQEASAYGLVESQLQSLMRVLVLRRLLRKNYAEQWQAKENEFVNSITQGATGEIFMLMDDQVQRLISSLSEHFNQPAALEAAGEEKA